MEGTCEQGCPPVGEGAWGLLSFLARSPCAPWVEAASLLACVLILSPQVGHRKLSLNISLGSYGTI